MLGAVGLFHYFREWRLAETGRLFSKVYSAVGTSLRENDGESWCVAEGPICKILEKEIKAVWLETAQKISLCGGSARGYRKGGTVFCLWPCRNANLRYTTG